MKVHKANKTFIQHRFIFHPMSGCSIRIYAQMCMPNYKEGSMGEDILRGYIPMMIEDRNVKRKLHNYWKRTFRVSKQGWFYDE